MASERKIERDREKREKKKSINKRRKKALKLQSLNEKNHEKKAYDENTHLCGWFVFVCNSMCTRVSCLTFNNKLLGC